MFSLNEASTSISEEILLKESQDASLLQLGHQYLLFKDIPHTVCNLSSASETLSGKYGDKVHSYVDWEIPEIEEMIDEEVNDEEMINDPEVT